MGRVTGGESAAATRTTRGRAYMAGRAAPKGLPTTQRNDTRTGTVLVIHKEAGEGARSLLLLGDGAEVNGKRGQKEEEA